MQEFIRAWVFNPWTGKIVTAVIGLLVVLFVTRFLQRSLGEYVHGNDARYRARKLVGFAAYVAAVIVIATVFSDQLGGLSVTLGVAGAGIAFALQEVIASVAGWVAISFANFYKTGDRVEVGGIRGDVIDVSILRTTLMEIGEWVNGDLYTGRVVRVANSFVFKAPVYNYSGEFPFLWDEIKIPVKYGSDYRLARKILEEIAEEVAGDYARTAKTAWQTLVQHYLIENATVAPMVSLVANDNWVEYTVRYVVDFKLRRSIKNAFFTRILEAFDETNGKVAFASMTVQLVETPVIDVRVAERRSA